MALKHENYVAIDLEMNQPSDRIIQVGVAIGRRGQAAEDYLVRNWLIHPGEVLDPFIVQLTGITDEALATNAVPLLQVAAELGALLDTHAPFVNPVTWGGGDSSHLRQAFNEAGIGFPHFGRRWIDIKTWHVMRELARGATPAGGLGKSMAKYGLKFEGQAHRADVDAFNTLRLFFRMLDWHSNVDDLARRANAL